ncbi:MAG: hypothetical protein M0Z95_05690 [Actinomycetota bacterium]|jgi:hypothetical protein|nr:hypothetical protein [Actinomycetota bacterium]
MKLSMFKSKKAIIATALAAGLAAGASGIAAAYFTSTGTGAGSANVGHSSHVTVAETGHTGTLYPGGPAETLTFTVTNNTPSSVGLFAASGKITHATTSSVGPKAYFPTGFVYTATSGALVGPTKSTGNNVPTQFGCQTQWFNLGAPTMKTNVLKPGASTTVTETISMNTGTDASYTKTQTQADEDACQNVNPKVTLHVTS